MDQPSLKLVAASHNPNGFQPPENKRGGHRESFFKSVQWSADGTTLFTTSSLHRVCSFVLPETLLEPRQSPLELTAHGTLLLPEATSAIAPCPYYALEHPSTQVILTASTDHPIHLHHAFPPTTPAPSSSSSSQLPPASDADTSDDSSSSSSSISPTPFTNRTPPPLPPQPPPLASFRLLQAETEAYLPVASLLWPAPGTHFVAGTANRIAVFDVSRPDGARAGPLLSIPTIPSARHLAKGGGVGMRGTVSALAAQPLSCGGDDGGGGGGGRGWGEGALLAAGTWTRNLGLYDLARAGDCVATWSVAGAAREAGVGGSGVMQTLWSPCGRYLVVNERRATGLLVYDLRGTRRLLGYLEGRDGETNQRLSCDVFPGSESTGGFEVWAGTKDGSVVVWEGVGSQEGGVGPSWHWRAHETAIGATAMHMSGSVVATCSGSWKITDDDEVSSASSDESASTASTVSRRSPKPKIVVPETSLKVWSIGPGDPSQTERRSLDGLDAVP
ncbi:hypothetical protein VTK56DRAFT_5026 [Thermocarpiscus australiensis]